MASILMNEEAEKDQKLKELAVLICALCRDDKPFGKVKLNKLLFYVDFVAYRDLGHPITGQEYQKLENGPAPRRLLPVIPSLSIPPGSDPDIVVQNISYYGLTQQRPIALRNPDTSKFTFEEIKLVEFVINHFWGKNATEISNESHKFIGWQLAGLREIIPYSIALVSNRGPTQSEREYGRRLEGLASECISR